MEPSPLVLPGASLWAAGKLEGVDLASWILGKGEKREGLHSGLTQMAQVEPASATGIVGRGIIPPPPVRISSSLFTGHGKAGEAIGLLCPTPTHLFSFFFFLIIFTFTHICVHCLGHLISFLIMTIRQTSGL
jgi:hypothetical protein